MRWLPPWSCGRCATSCGTSAGSLRANADRGAAGIVSTAGAGSSAAVLCQTKGVCALRRKVQETQFPGPHPRVKPLAGCGAEPRDLVPLTFALDLVGRRTKQPAEAAGPVCGTLSVVRTPCAPPPAVCSTDRKADFREGDTRIASLPHSGKQRSPVGAGSRSQGRNGFGLLRSRDFCCLLLLAGAVRRCAAKTLIP